MSRTTRNKLVCQYCRLRPPVPGRKGCKHCMRQNRQYTSARRAGLYDAGLCQHCGEVPPEPGRKGCRECLDVARMKMSILRAAA